MLTADLHCDTLLELQGGADLASNPDGHVDLPRLRAGNVGLQVFVGFVSTTFPTRGRAFREAMALLDLWEKACVRHDDVLAPVRTSADIGRAVSEGKVAALPAIENGHAIEEDLGKLEALAERGIRAMTLCHSRHLPWCASSGEPGDGPGGLTRFGREVVRAMNDLGIVVDLSHVHETSFWQALKAAGRPLIASHSCAAALCPTPRNLTDDQIRAVADTGGVVGINFYPGFLDRRYFERRGGSAGQLFAALEAIERETLDDPVRRNREMRALSRRWLDAQGPAEADVDTVCDQVEHVARLAGEDGVAFGSDFDGVPDLPRGVGGADAFPAILDRLRERGWSDDRLRKLAWDNVLRVLRDNE